MEFNESEYIVYTCLIGENEGLNIQPHIKNSKLRHVCLTDDKNLSSNDWEIINVNRIFPKDCYRSQRNFKIRPHIIFPDYKYSFYIDNTVVLKKKSEDFIKMILKKKDIKNEEPFFCVPFHSQFDLINEFNACLENRLDDQLRIREQLDDYMETNILEFKKKAYWGGILLRNHNHKEVIDFSEIWFAHICRYSRRDQLSLIHSSSQSNINLKGFYLENSNSNYHKWPITKNKRKNRVYSKNYLNKIPFSLVEDLEKTLKSKESEIEKLNEEINSYLILKIFKKFKKYLSKIKQYFLN